MAQEKKLEVKDLRITFKTDNGLVQAVRNISFDLYKGETLCIVGESGSGKSVTSKAIMGILAANAIVESGSIIYEGENLLDVSEEEFHKIRGHKIGMIFQDPLSSLNPIVRIGKQITEATLVNANKFKQKYNDIISKEQMAYKNTIARSNIAIQKAQNKYNLFHVEAVKRMSCKDTEEGIAYYGAINECESVIEAAKAKYDAVYSEQLSILKNENFEEAIAYNAAIEEHKQTLLQLKEEIDTLKKSIKENKEDQSLKSKLAELKASSKEKKLASKENLNNKMATLEEPYKVKQAERKAKFDEAVANAKREYEEAVANANSELSAKLPPLKSALEMKMAEVKVKVIAEIEAEKINLKDTILSEKEKLRGVLPPLKTALDDKKKEAKAEIKAYKAQIKAEYKNAVANLSEKYPELKANKKYTEELDLIKQEYISKTKITKAEAKRRALDIMKEVGIPFPEKRFKQYPFEFSGGMRQRIVIAIALTANPDVLICDEPTTALDVTIQAQILELINKLKRERNLSCIFITHDLGVVANMADRVAVMYAGKIVEYGNVNEIFFEPKHPYTWALLSSIPDVDSKERLEAIPGTPPDMIYPPKGDAFALRSKYAMEIDYKYQPPFFKVSDTHYAATWLLHPDAPQVEMPSIVSERIKNALKNADTDKEVSSNE